MTTGVNELQTEATGKATFTARSVAIGALMCVLIGIIDPYWVFYLKTSSLFFDYSVGGAVFLLFLLLLVFNVGLRRLWGKFALRPGELVVVTAMMLAAGAVTTMGLVGYLVPNMVAPYYFAAPSNQWDTELLPHLPRWLLPLDAGGGTSAITKFYDGLKEGESIPWGPWIKPLMRWAVFLVALYTCMTCIMTIMRKQWVDHERLSFPIAQISQELCACAARPWGPLSILRSPLFWVGFGVPFLVGSLARLSGYFPGVPTIRTAYDWQGGAIPFSVRLSFAVLGFTFLIPNRIVFSVFFLNVISFAIRYYMETYRLGMQEELGVYGASKFPVFAHQGTGALLVLVATSLWLSRQHLVRALRCALGLGERGYDRNEPSSYLTALIGLVLSLIVMILWTWKSGLSPLYSCVYVAVALIIFYGMARVVAQCGVSVTISPMIASPLMVSTFGAGKMTGSDISALTMSWVWHSDIRTSVMSSAAHAMYLARRKARGLLWILLLAVLITMATATVWTIWLGYHGGANNLEQWFFADGPKRCFGWGVRHIVQAEGPNYEGMVWSGVGAAIMAGLVLAQRTLFWWPIHPIGFLICSVFWTDTLWLTIFLAWIIKVAVVKLGGNRAFRFARQFFLGMILGQFTVAGFWASVDIITGKTGNGIFWI